MKLEEAKAGVSKFSSDFIKDRICPAAVLRLDGTVIQLNAPFQEKFGIGLIKNIKDLLDEKSLDMWDAFSRHPLTDTTFTTHSVGVRLFYSEEVGEVGALFTNLENTEKKKEMCYLNAFKKSDRFIAFIDKNNVVQDVNELCYEFFNVRREYFIGKKTTVFEKLFTDASFKYEEFLDKLIKEGCAETLSHYEQSPGVRKYYRAMAFFDEETDMFTMHISDETEMIDLKEQLAHKDTLSDVVQLAASVVHEIRNPLTTLKGFTQLLRISATEESKRYLSVIDDEIIRMESILNELLFLSKPQKNDKEILSLQDILSEVLHVISANAHLERITIVKKEDAFSNFSICGDENKLKQVLFNLLKNALESMTPGGTLTTGLSIGKDGYIKLTIEDTGKGMGAEQLSQIFMPYFTTRSEGTGLGLPFVIKIVEDHGGTITAESEVGLGSKFTLSFPPRIPLRSNATVDEGMLLALGFMA